MLYRCTALAALSCVAASATTLVALWSPERLLIGADSNVITNMPDVLGTACKISQDGAIFYAFSGLVEDKTVGYSVEAIAHAAAQGPGDLSIHLTRFVQDAHDPLSRAVAALKKDAPDQYEYLQQSHPVLQAIFADVESGPPTLGVAAVSLAPDGTLIDFTRIVARGDDGLGPRLIYAGQQNQIKEYLRYHRDWINDDRTALVRTLIQREINASKGEVGGPIDILAIEPNTAHWIQKKQQCK